MLFVVRTAKSRPQLLRTPAWPRDEYMRPIGEQRGQIGRLNVDSMSRKRGWLREGREIGFLAFARVIVREAVDADDVGAVASRRWASVDPMKPAAPVDECLMRKSVRTCSGSGDGCPARSSDAWYRPPGWRAWCYHLF